MKNKVCLLVLLLTLFSNINAQISDYSRNIITGLEDNITIYVFFNENLPFPYSETKTYLQKLLYEYKNISGSKIKFDFYDPATSGVVETLAEDYGIPPLQVQVSINNQDYAVKAYMGMVLTLKNKFETIKLIAGDENLDFEIAHSIKQLTQKEKTRIGIFTRGDFPDLTELKTLRTSIGKHYDIVEIDNSTNYTIGDNIKTMIVFSPESGEIQKDKNKSIPLLLNLDQYIMNGGRVIFLHDKVLLSESNGINYAEPVSTGLEDLLLNYGFKINESFIADKECAYVAVPIQTEPYYQYKQVPFPFYPRILNINKDIPFLFRLQQIFFGFSNNIDTSSAGNGINIIPLIYSSDQYEFYNDKTQVDVLSAKLPENSYHSAGLLLGVCYEGEFNSYFAGNAHLKNTGTNLNNIILKSKHTKLILLGNGEFIKDKFYAPIENGEFIAALLDYITN